MGTLKAVIGYGVGLAVFVILCLYAIRLYRQLANDTEHKLARRDGRLQHASTPPATYVATGVSQSSLPISAALKGSQRPCSVPSMTLRMRECA